MFSSAGSTFYLLAQNMIQRSKQWLSQHYAIHNFICIHDPKEGELAETQDPEYENQGSNAGDEVVTQLEGFDGTNLKILFNIVI